MQGPPKLTQQSRGHMPAVKARPRRGFDQMAADLAGDDTVE